jgi:hypothetical protein
MDAAAASTRLASERASVCGVAGCRAMSAVAAVRRAARLTKGGCAAAD